MRLASFALFSFISVGCTKSNPAKLCEDGTCTDPSFPFCDVSGAIAGEAGACIAASCSADTFIECREDVEVRCNVDGTNYNLAQCDLGCDDSLGGCRLCAPGETTCTNGKVVSCDATGVQTVLETCPLGCFANEPRCIEIDPSNSFAMYLDMVPDPPDLTLVAGSFSTVNGDVFDGAQQLTVPNFAVPAVSGGVAARVFVVGSISITQASASTGSNEPGPALVILARGDIEITGRLGAGRAGSGAGIGACNAGPGTGPNTCNSACTCSAASAGGGAYGSNGAKGGNINGFVGGSGGIANGTEQLVPLRGGCPSGLAHKRTTTVYGFGGGAIQLVSRTRILIDGIIDTRGADGGGTAWSPDGGTTRGGAYESGGAGGAILLEAPVVSLGPNGSLLATGGRGGNANCTFCGAGATPGVAATPGTDRTATCSVANADTSFAGGGGGGGLGRIRINTADGTYLKSSSANEGGAVTAGTLATR